MIRRGEVWWSELPDEGGRPVLVMTRNEAIPVLNSVLVAPLTRRVRRIPSELELGPADGLRVECAASFDNLRVVPKAMFTRKLASVEHRLPEACRALAAAVDC